MLQASAHQPFKAYNFCSQAQIPFAEIRLLTTNWLWAKLKLFSLHTPAKKSDMQN